MNKMISLLVLLFIMLSTIGTQGFFSCQKGESPTILEQSITDQKTNNIKSIESVHPKSQVSPTTVQRSVIDQKSNKITSTEFMPLKSQITPAFIKLLNNAKDVKIDFHYEGDYPTFGRAEPEFYISEGSKEKFLSISKLKKRKDTYAYGPEYHAVFNHGGSHSYRGTPIYLLNKDSEYSISYVGFQINNRDLISELKIEIGIDYLTEQENGNLKSSSLASIFSIESAYACGPGRYLRLVGESKLTFVKESNSIAWYRLEKPIALYNLRLSYCDEDCSLMPAYCRDWIEVPPECEEYSCCHHNASITNLENGNLRMHIFYKPNDKEGFLKLQIVNLILSGPVGRYYQPIMGKSFDHYYRAYLH